MTSKAAFWGGVVIEVLLISTVAVVSVCMRQFLEPFHRGFFKDDESLMYRFKPSTITSMMLYIVGFLVPSFSVILIEFVHVKLSSDKYDKEWNSHTGNDPEDPVSWRTCLWKCFSTLIPFYFGAAATHAVTNLFKYSVGRLRPHFFDVCQPNWSLLNGTAGYIEADICTGQDADRLREARLSFPSGHSSIAMYCSVYFALYLYHRFTWKRITLICPILQLIVIGAGIFTCLSRISDYKHHWSDVLAGGFLGCLIAVLSVMRISYIFTTKRHPLKMKCKYKMGEQSQRVRSISENGRGRVSITAL